MAVAIMGVVLGLLVLVLIFIKSGALFIKVESVPDGVEWRSHYRKMKAKRGRRAGPMTWLLVGTGVALLLVGVVAAVMSMQ